MDMTETGRKLNSLWRKYKWALAVLVLGLMLMVLPFGSVEQTEQSVTVPVIQSADPQLELTQILGQIRGVGKVQVLLTVKSGETVKYQTDEDITTSDTGSAIRKETVIITDANRSQQALVQQVLPPEYMGAVVVCQGAEDAAVRLAVVDAVSKATGLGADRITVLKMK